MALEDRRQQRIAWVFFIHIFVYVFTIDYSWGLVNPTNADRFCGSDDNPGFKQIPPPGRNDKALGGQTPEGQEFMERKRGKRTLPLPHPRATTKLVRSRGLGAPDRFQDRRACGALCALHGGSSVWWLWPFGRS